jgi:transcriptional regulator with XRE-family HTH domain
MLAKEFGQRLKGLREERGLTQRELAARIKSHAPQVTRYETGFCLPNAETLVAISETLQVDLGMLLVGRPSGNASDEPPVKDIRLLERVRELEHLDRRFRDTAVAVLEALILQGHQETVRERMAAGR